MKDNLLIIERVEILKGSQGTLYGKNTMGGVINVHTRALDNETEARLGLDYGSEDFRRANALFRTPLITDRLFHCGCRSSDAF